MQDTLLSIHRARHTYSPEKPVGPWLYAICEHRMLDHLRKYRRLEKMEILGTDDFENVGNFHRDDEGSEKGEQIQTVLADLPEKQRKVIELLKVHDLSVKEVAAQTGMSESAVKVTAFRGYEAIRRFFGVKEK